MTRNRSEPVGEQTLSQFARFVNEGLAILSSQPFVLFSRGKATGYWVCYHVPGRDVEIEKTTDRIGHWAVSKSISHGFYFTPRVRRNAQWQPRPSVTFFLASRQIPVSLVLVDLLEMVLPKKRVVVGGVGNYACKAVSLYRLIWCSSIYLGSWML